MDPEQIAELNEQLRQLTAVMGVTTASMAGSEASYRKIPGSVGGVIDTIAKFGKTSSETTSLADKAVIANEAARGSLVNFCLLYTSDAADE